MAVAVAPLDINLKLVNIGQVNMVKGQGKYLFWEEMQRWFYELKLSFGVKLANDSPIRVI